MARASVVLKRGQAIVSDFLGEQIQGSCCFSPSNRLHAMSKESPLSVSAVFRTARVFRSLQIACYAGPPHPKPETLASLLLPGKNLDTPQFLKQ